MLIRKLAFQYAEKNDIKHSFHNTSKLAGVDWLTGFLHRHPEISVRSPEKLSAARASGMNKMTCSNKHFCEIRALMEKHMFPYGIVNSPE